MQVGYSRGALKATCELTTAIERITTVLAMACISSSRFCARAQEKLCQLLINNFSKNHNIYHQPSRKFVSPATSGATYSVVSTVTNFGNRSSESKQIIGFCANASPVRKFTNKAKPIYTQTTCDRHSSCLTSLSSESHPCIREYSSVHTQQPAGPVREIQVDPYLLLEDDLKIIYDGVRKLVLSNTTSPELQTIASYYFDGQGKALRPMVCMLMARCINYHMNKESRQLLDLQRSVAMYSEMVHSASLVHDDVIDQSDFRRGKPSVNVLWNHKKVTMAGDFILSVASILIANLRNDDVTIYLSQVITDLIQGEFMQLGSKETENERFAHYLTKTYRKTASLIANSLKAVATLAGADEQLVDLSFQYGRNLGLAFQLVDDLLDFVSSAETMGKPTAADLKLGLATAPVLFACEKYPELNPMIMRRFQEPGDVERAFELVHKSQGLEQTRFLARKHCIEAIRLAQEMADSPYQKGLCVVSDLVVNRMK